MKSIPLPAPIHFTHTLAAIGLWAAVHARAAETTAPATTSSSPHSDHRYPDLWEEQHRNAKGAAKGVEDPDSLDEMSGEREDAFAVGLVDGGGGVHHVELVVDQRGQRSINY